LPDGVIPQITPSNVADRIQAGTIGEGYIAGAFLSRVDDVELDVSGLESDVSDLTGIASDLGDQADTLAGNLAAQAALIGSIQSTLNDLINTPDFDSGTSYAVDALF